MGQSGFNDPKRPDHWWVEEPGYVVAIIAVLALLWGLREAGDAKTFATFTAAVGTIAGHSLGGAGKRRADERASKALRQADRHADALRRVKKELDGSSPNVQTLKSVVSDALEG